MLLMLIAVLSVAVLVFLTMVRMNADLMRPLPLKIQVEEARRRPRRHEAP